jgi:hypothetical protein
MAGNSANYGDHFSLVKGAQSSSTNHSTIPLTHLKGRSIILISLNAMIFLFTLQRAIGIQSRNFKQQHQKLNILRSSKGQVYHVYLFVQLPKHIFPLVSVPLQVPLVPN